MRPSLGADTYVKYFLPEVNKQFDSDANFFYIPDMDTEKTAIERAIEIAGGPSALARAVGVLPSNIAYWKNVSIPPRRAIQIEEATGVSRSELRPDLWQ